MHKILQLCGALVAILGSQAVVPVSLVILCMFLGGICATIRKHRVIQYLLYVGLKRNRKKNILLPNDLCIGVALLSALDAL